MTKNAIRAQYARKFKDSKVPLTGLFELTGRCNFDCKMCYVHTKPNIEFLKTEKNGDWWISVIDEACDQGMLFATLTGGECLMHPDFYRIYMHLKERGVFVDVKTNGLLMNQKNVSFFKENPPFEIQLTLYACNDDSYEKVTGLRAFHQVEAAIKRIKEAGLDLFVSVTPNTFAPGETERIIDYLKENQIQFGITDALLDTFDDNKPRTMAEKNIEIDEKIRYLRKQKGIEDPVQLIEDLPPIGGNKTGSVRGLKCGAGRFSFAISHDGCMRPCGSLHNLRVPINSPDDFAAAWQQMMEINRNYLLPIECEGCAYFKACQSCAVIRSGKVGNGHCDPDVCEMTRKLVAAGVKKI